MRTKFMTRKPEWLGTRTINCYISISEVAGQVVKGEFLPNQKAQKNSSEFPSKIAELIHEFGGVATIIDSYSAVVYWSMTDDAAEAYERVLRFGIELKKLVGNRLSGSMGRRKVAIVISGEEENSSLFELSKACLIKSYELILTQKAYEQVQNQVKAIPIGSLRSSVIYLFQDTIPPSVAEDLDVIIPQSNPSVAQNFEIKAESGYKGGEIEIRSEYKMVLSQSKADSTKEYILMSVQ